MRGFGPSHNKTDILLDENNLNLLFNNIFIKKPNMPKQTLNLFAVFVRNAAAFREMAEVLGSPKALLFNQRALAIQEALAVPRKKQMETQ